MLNPSFDNDIIMLLLDIMLSYQCTYVKSKLRYSQLDALVSLIHMLNPSFDNDIIMLLLDIMLSYQCTYVKSKL